MFACQLATVDDLGEIRHLLNRGRRIFRAIGDEDLPALVERRCAVVSEESGRLWGFAGLFLEERPATLPPTAPDRAYLRALALAAGHPALADGASLMTAATRTLRPHPRPILVIAHTLEAWLGELLIAGDFALSEVVQTFRLNRLNAWRAEQPYPAHANVLPIQLRPLHPADLEAVTQLDAAAFDSLWHFGAKEMWELVFSGQMQAAFVDARMIGYTATTFHGREAHLTRIAVHPQWQGQGVGRRLLAAAIQTAQQHGVQELTLNTQVSNQRSQQLYRHFGFAPTTQTTQVYTRLIESKSLQKSDQSP